MPALPSAAIDSRIALRLCGSTPDGGLVEQQQARLVEQPDADVEPALHAAAVGRRPVPGAVGEADELEHLVVRDLSVAPPRPYSRPKNSRFSRAAEVRVDRELLGHVPDPGLGRDRPDVDRRARRASPRQRRARAGRRPSRSSSSCRRRWARAGRTSRPRGSRTRRPSPPRSSRSACAGRGPRARPCGHPRWRLRVRACRSPCVKTLQRAVDAMVAVRDRQRKACRPHLATSCSAPAWAVGHRSRVRRRTTFCQSVPRVGLPRGFPGG